MTHKREHILESGHKDGKAFAYFRSACGEKVGWRDVSTSERQIDCPRCLSQMAMKLEHRLRFIHERMVEVVE